MQQAWRSKSTPVFFTNKPYIIYFSDPEPLKMKNSSLSQNKNFKILLFLLAVVLSILALHYRKPDAFTRPQFWAEDGLIFFGQCYLTDIESIFTTHAGYLHLIPRIITWVTFHTVSFEHTPLAYNIASLLLFLGLVAFIWFRTKSDAFTRFYMILTLSLVPVGNEIVLTITNAQWYLNLFIPLIFLTGYNKKYFVYDGVLLFLVALTGPFSVIYFPIICAIVWYRSRTYGLWKNERWLFFVYMLAAVIQLVALALATTRVPNSWGVMERITHAPRLLYLQLTNPLGIPKYYEEIHWKLFVVLLLGLLGWIFLCWRKFTREKNATPLFFIVAAVVSVAANIYVLAPDMWAFLNPISNGMRYFFCPCVLFLWSVLAYTVAPAQTTETPGKKEKAIPMPLLRNIGLLLLFTYYTIMMVKTIPPFILEDLNWPEQAKKLENFHKGRIEIPINPRPINVVFEK